MDVLKQTQPVARKEHICAFCGGVIKKGEKYNRVEIVDSGDIYDWTTHIHCDLVASLLDMYYENQDGLESESFLLYIDEYVEENHYDAAKKDIDVAWKLPYPQLVEKVYEELMSKK